MNQLIESKIDKALFANITAEGIESLKEELREEIDSEQIDLHVDIVRAVNAYGNDLLRQELKQLHIKHFGKEHQLAKGRVGLKYILLVLIGILSIGAATYLLKAKNSGKTSMQLFAEYYSPVEFNSTQRNMGQGSTIILEDLYQGGQYAEYIELWERNFGQREDLTSEVILASGVAYVEMDSYDKAIKQFDVIIDNNDFSYADQASWYKAMTLLRADDLISCRRVLQEIILNPDSDYKAESQSLLKKLDSIAPQ